MQTSFSSAARRSQLWRSRRRSGFTLVEIVVVLAIAALISSVTLGGFKELGEGNKRTSCQTNLTQIYQAMRQYMADEGGNAPLYYYQNPKTNKIEKNIGLWALWTFPRDGNRNDLADVGDKPINRYIRHSKVFHCPADDDSDRLDLFKNGRTQYNMNYLSYQVDSKEDPLTGIYPTATDDNLPASQRDTQTYMPSRTTDSTNPLWRRQLDHAVVNTPSASDPDYFKRSNRPASDDTVITWCPWHRYSRERDIVLFMDGSVQQIPREQSNLDATCTPIVAAPTVENWQRTPKLPQCTY